MSNTSKTKVKFMMAWEDGTQKVMRKEAKKRHISVQEMLRAVVIPEWLAVKKGKPASSA